MSRRAEPSSVGTAANRSIAAAPSATHSLCARRRPLYLIDGHASPSPAGEPAAPRGAHAPAIDGGGAIPVGTVSAPGPAERIDIGSQRGEVDELTVVLRGDDHPGLVEA